MKKLLSLLLAAGFLTSCAETASNPSSALPIANQDTSTTVPGNSPIADRMGADGSYQYNRKVTTDGMTPLAPTPAP